VLSRPLADSFAVGRRQKYLKLKTASKVGKNVSLTMNQEKLARSDK
jgi:hypothetical protein